MYWNYHLVMFQAIDIALLIIFCPITSCIAHLVNMYFSVLNQAKSNKKIKTLGLSPPLDRKYVFLARNKSIKIKAVSITNSDRVINIKY